MPAPWSDVTRNMDTRISAIKTVQTGQNIIEFNNKMPVSCIVRGDVFYTFLKSQIATFYVLWSVGCVKTRKTLKVLSKFHFFHFVLQC